MTAEESIAAAIDEIDEKKEKLKEAFDDLQGYRSLLSPSFNFSWSEIDSHFSSTTSSLINRFRLLQSAADSPDSDRVEASTVEAPLLWPELRTFCEKKDGKGLGKYMIDNWKKRLSMKSELPAAIQSSGNPTALVLDAIEGSYLYSPSSPSSSSAARKIDLGRVFVVLLEALIEIKANLTNDLRERARTLAYDWKSNMSNNKPSEALVFLHLVSCFELGSLFKTEELADYIFLIGRNKEATTISKMIGLDQDVIAGLVKKFLHTGRLLVAIKFIYEFEMTGRFEPVSVLKTSLKNSREASKRVCAEGNNSFKAQSEAIDKELGGVRKVIKVIKERNLELEFSEEKLEECVQELEKKKAQRRNATTLNTQKPQQQLNKKRPRVVNGTCKTIPPQSQQPPLLPNPSLANLQANPYGHVSSTVSGVVPLNQRKLLPDPSHNLQPNPHGLVRSTNGVAVPYGNPLAPYGPAPTPALALASQHVHYQQQTGHGGYGWRPQYRPPYYPQ